MRPHDSYGHRPDCDPILAAGFMYCGDCQGRSYPADAEWIADHLILASFGPIDGEPECRRRHRGRLLLVDLDADDDAIPQRQPRKCRGTVRNGPRRGQPCRNWAAIASAYCAQHDPDRQETL